MFGRFFVHLCYLDQEWAKKMLAGGRIFPMAEDKSNIWKADWQGYMLFSKFYSQIFELLKNHYDRGINNLIHQTSSERKSENDRLAEHMMISYLWGLEDLDQTNSLINKFFKKAPMIVRQHAIYFIGGSLEKILIEDKINRTNSLPKLKTFWAKRVKEAKDEELLAFLDWLENVPENESIDSLIDLIKPSIKPSKGYLFLHDLFGYLIDNAKNHPVSTISILLEVIKVKKTTREGYADPSDMRKIIEETRKCPECKEMVNEAVNALSDMGYFEFRPLLVA